MLLAPSGNYWVVGQPDAWVGLLCIIILLAASEPNPSSRTDYLYAGVAIGLAALIKPLYAVFALPLVLPFIFRRKDSSPNAQYVITTIVGCSLVWAVVLVALQFANAITPFFDAFVIFNIVEHVGRHDRTLEEALEAITKDLFSDDTFSKSIVIIGGSYLVYKHNPQRGLAFLLTITCAYLSAVIQQKWYQYHFLPFNMLLGLLVGISLEAARHVTTHLPRCRIPDLLVASAVLLSSAHVAWTRIEPTLETILLISKHKQDGSDLGKEFVFNRGSFSYQQTKEVALYIKQTVPQDRTIYLWGFDAMIYFLSERRSASRFGYNYPLIATNNKFAALKRNELMKSLTDFPPAAIVVQAHDANNLYKRSSKELLEEFPELKNFIHSHYRQSFKNLRFAVYIANTEPNW